MKPSAFGQANKADPLPFWAPDKDKTASTHTTKFTDIPVEFVLCLRFFCGDFCAIVTQKHQQNFNKCLAVCIIVAESACHCDEFDKSKFCNLPKNHLLECSRIEIFIPKYYTVPYK